MRTIHKHQAPGLVRPGTPVAFDVHRGARLLCVREQSLSPFTTAAFTTGLVANTEQTVPTLWFEVDDEEPKERRAFTILGTGWPVPKGAEYRGTAVCGAFVWHVYEEGAMK